MGDRTEPEAQARTNATGIGHMMRPRSVAIIGMSSKAGTPSANVLTNLLVNGYDGEVFLVGRSGGTIQGRPCLTSVDQLPTGVDLAIMLVPGDAVRETVEACVARGVKSAVCFSSGFAETGQDGRREQDRIGRIAREGGLALLGPNCVGFFNYVDAFAAMLMGGAKLEKLSADGRPALAILAQSGGIGHHLTHTLEQRGVLVSYMITTGNEADLGLPDIIAFLLEEKTTSGIVCYAEQIRRPADMLAVATLARERRKPILLLHPGRTAKARAATASHTGAMTGDHAVMRTVIQDSGIIVVDTLELLLDLAQIVVRYPDHSGDGLGIVTASGALCGISEDYCAGLGLELPPMSPAQVDLLRPHLPDFTPPRNPLDLGTLPAWQPEVLRLATSAMLDDPAIGSVMVSNPYVGPPISTEWAKAAIGFSAAKPMIYVVHNEDMPLPGEARAILSENRIVVMRSPERAMRALAALTAHAQRRRGWSEPVAAEGFADLPALGQGPQPEWLGKQLLARIGIAIPDGGLARSMDEALAIASRIGFPVAIKAQAASLAHKSEAGGVLLDIADEAALRRQWLRLHDNIAGAKPGLKLDGVLVERMGERGLELAVGARRDPQWGPVLMVGVGGIWIEALADVRLLPVAISEARIVEELGKLKAARLLHGFRGSPPVDIAAVAHAAALIGRLMSTRPEIIEIDVNPLVAYGAGKGVVALDALIVTR